MEGAKWSIDRPQAKCNETNKLVQDKTHSYKEMALILSTDDNSNIHSILGANWNTKEPMADMESLRSSPKATANCGRRMTRVRVVSVIYISNTWPGEDHVFSILQTMQWVDFNSFPAIQ